MSITTETTYDPKAAFVDGRHKRGGTIYSVNAYNSEGVYVQRAAVACVAKYRAGRAATGNAYLVNNWLAPEFIGGERQDKVTYYRNRALAMAKVAELAAEAQEIAADAGDRDAYRAEYNYHYGI